MFQNREMKQLSDSPRHSELSSLTTLFAFQVNKNQVSPEFSSRFLSSFTFGKCVAIKRNMLPPIARLLSEFVLLPAYMLLLFEIVSELLLLRTLPISDYYVTLEYSTD